VSILFCIFLIGKHCPYDVFSPLPEIISERLKTLALLPQVKRAHCGVGDDVNASAAPREHVLANSFAIKVGDDLIWS